MKCIALKLVSGEEIVGRVHSQSLNSDMITISHARVVGLQHDENGRMGVGMMDYTLTSRDAEISISKDKIITQFSMSAEAERAYLAHTSGIQL